MPSPPGESFAKFSRTQRWEFKIVSGLQKNICNMNGPIEECTTVSFQSRFHFGHKSVFSNRQWSIETESNFLLERL